MPGFEEVQSYMVGLWLLFRSNRAGFAYMDFSERGSLRSFWAILWCMPPILVSWIWARMVYLDGMPPETPAGLLFFFRLAMSEFFGWIAPVLLLAALCLVAGFGNRFNALVAACNWMAVPFSYANGLVLLLMMVLPGMPGLTAFLLILLLGVVVFAMERIVRMICGPHMLFIAAVILVQIVPVLYLSDWIDRFLGISPP